MPEAYTHIRIGTAAAQTAGFCPSEFSAFALGCQGPDLLFCYRVWQSSAKRSPNLPALGGKMHNQKTGLFLQNLINNAETKVQKDYTAGFLCHYGADCTLHPYVYAITQNGQVYGEKGGHGYFEAALDSTLHRKDFGNGGVSANKSCPKVPQSAVKEIAQLLQKAILQTYGQDIAAQAFEDSYAHTRFLRGLFVSRLKIKWVLFWIAERLAFGGAGFITGHLTPAKLKADLPAVWVHPATKQTVKADVFALVEQAQHRAGELLKTYQAYQNKTITFEQLSQVIGNYSYENGGLCGE